MVNITITKLGLEKIAGATVEAPLVIEKFALGDGGGQDIEPDENMTALVGEKYRGYINDKYSNGNNITVECTLPSSAEITEGFYIREIGLFDVEGTMIAIAKTPLQFRPSSDGGNIVTELMFSMVMQVNNSNAITIEIPQSIFATTDALERLLKRVENLINSSIGIEKWFNTDNQYKNQNIVTIGVKTYALMDENNILQIVDYPLLFKNINAVDRGDGTFAMPNFYDGTTRHLPKGSNRDLGSYQDDAMQRITFGFWVRNISINNERGEMAGVESGALKKVKNTNNGWVDVKLSGWGNTNHNEFNFDNSRVARTDNETRMKNTAGQWYILAKVNV